MINLKDVTFTIPVRIDTEARIRNIRTVVLYLCKYFDTNILIAEESSTSEVPKILENLPVKYSYAHIKTDNPLMHRTKVLNIMAKAAQTPIIVNYDTDVLLKPEQYVSAAAGIRQNRYDMIYPYDGRFIDINGDVLHHAINNLDVNNLSIASGNLIHPQSLGGAVFWNKQKFLEIGGENQNCISWGFEDNERLTRATKMNCRTARINGCIFHMYHPPSLNSANADHPAYINNQNEYNKVNSMNKDQLSKYIQSWSWK